MKARIYNGKWAGNHTQHWLDANQDKVIGGQLVSEWTLTEVLPTEQEKGYLKLMFDFETYTYYEGATPEEIAEANKPIVPQTARSMNFRLVLIQNGISMQSIYDLIASRPFPENELAYQMFEYATHYDRNNAMLNKLADLMGISQTQLDNYFIQAENLVV